MNISRRYTEFWNKFKGVSSRYFKILLITVGIVGALFVGYKLDADAADAPTEDTQTYGTVVTEGFGPAAKQYIYLHVYGEIPSGLNYYYKEDSLVGDTVSGSVASIYDQNNHWVKLPADKLVFIFGTPNAPYTVTLVRNATDEVISTEVTPDAAYWSMHVGKGVIETLKDAATENKPYDSIYFGTGGDKTVEISPDVLLNCTLSEAQTNCTIKRVGHGKETAVSTLENVGWSEKCYHDATTKYVITTAENSRIGVYKPIDVPGQSTLNSEVMTDFTVDTSSSTPNYKIPCIAKGIKITLTDTAGNALEGVTKFTNSYYFNNSDSNDYKNPRKYKTGTDTYTWGFEKLIEFYTKTNANYLPVQQEQLNTSTSGCSCTYSPENKILSVRCISDATVAFNAYTKALYFGSITHGQEDNPWQNEAFKNGYILKYGTGTGETTVSQSDDYSKGAWKIVYNDTFSQQTFNITPNLGYEFDTSTAYTLSATGCTATKGTLTGNKMTFTASTDDTSPAEAFVKVGNQKYTEFKTTFKYENTSYKLTDLCAAVLPYYILIVGDPIPKDEVQGIFIQTWTIASNISSDPEKYAGLFLVKKNQGYMIDDDVTVKLNGTALPKVESFDEDLEDEYENGFYWLQKLEESETGTEETFLAIFCTTPLQDNQITIDNIKWHYDVEFNPQNDSVRNDVNINNDRGNWGKSITADLAHDESFTVNLDLVNERKIFKSADEVCSAIKRVNTGLDDMRCLRNSDTSVTLTIPHSTSQRDITIPSDLFNWKISSADFSVDFSFVDESYEDEAFQSIKLHKGNGEQGELIELKKGNHSDIVNVSTVSDVLYNDLIYTLSCDGRYVDLSQATVSIDGGVEGEASVVGTPSNKKFVFRLNPDCEGAPYRTRIKFKVDNLKSSLKNIPIVLCPKAILYLEKSDGTLQHIATAPNDFGREVTLGVPAEGGANYVVMYPDYSKIFDLTCVEGKGVEDPVLENFNRVKFHVNPSKFDDGDKIVCNDPSESAPPVKFTPVEGFRYYNVKDDKTIDMDSSIQGTISIPYGQEFSFAVKCNEGYDDSTLEMRANGTEFTEDSEKFKKKRSEDGYYVLTIAGSEAKYPITITGNVHATQKKITFNKSLGGDFGNCDYIYNGASVNQDIMVLYGQGIAFEVTLPENCNQSDIKVKFNDTELSKVNGRYILNNITSDGTITVSNVSLNKYPVTFASNPRATYKNKDGSALSGTIDVSHGDSFEFRVQPNSGYTMGDDSVVYLRYANGQTTTLQPSNDVYKISNLTQSCTVSVENVEDIVYTITLVPVDGVTYLNDVDNVIRDYVKIKHGRNFEFSISLSDEYDDSLGGMNIIVNDGRSAQSYAQKLASGRYVVPNVSEDMTIKVGNVRKNTYTVTLMGAEGIDYYNPSGKIITGDNQAEHYSDFSFKVQLYPAYAGSDINVMLGDTPMSVDKNGFYTISKISESKTVTVVGVEQNDESLLVNKINNLPDTLNSLGDVDNVIEATKAYEALSDSQKALIGNADKLKALQEQVKQFHHVSNDVRISGIDWYIKLYAIPITDDTDACGRIYKKLGSEYILSLYNVYLWNTLTDTRYTLPEGQSAVITLPTPDMTYFEKPTAIHEKESGRIDFITPSISGSTTTFQTDSFSPMGIIASRSSTPGRSSLLDAADANLGAISNFAASVFGNDTNRVTRSGSGNGDYNDLSPDSENDELSGNIDEKFRSRNNKVTAVGSALRLILVLMILILIGLMIYFFVKRRKDRENAEEE